MGAEAGLGALAVELLHHGVEGALQIGHGDALVDDHALHLVEHGGVGGVHLVLAVDPAGGDDADGQRHGVHGPHLHGGGLAAEHHPAVLVKIEGVRPVAAGVPLAGVEPVEVQLGQLHLGAVQHGEAHADEDVLELVQGDIHGVPVAHRHGLAGNGDVQRLGLQPGLQRLGLQLPALGLQLGLQSGAHLVGQLAHGGPLLGGELAHLLEYGSELALLAQILDPQGVQFCGRSGLRKRGQSLRADGC